jgi:hypothetical protein
MLLKSKKISRFEKLLSTVYKFSVCCCRFECCFISLHLEPKNIRTNYQYQSVFKVLALALPWRHLHLLIAVLNGLGSFKE